MNNILIAQLKDKETIIFKDWEEDLTKYKNNLNLGEFESFSEEKIFKFDVNYRLDNDEIFYIELDDNDIIEMIDPFLKVIKSTWDFNPIIENEYKKIISLCFIEKKENLYNIFFSRVYPRNYIMKKTLLWFWDNWPIISEENNKIDFSSLSDAFWDSKNKKLFFKKYETIKPIFKWIEKFYRSASEEEIDNFLEKDFFSINDDFDKKKMWERLYKNIADIIDNRDIDFSNIETRTQYNKYAKEFLWDNVSINDDWKFEIKKNKDLTNIVKLLQWHYYLDYITEEKKETNYSKDV